MIILKTQEQIAKMNKAGDIFAECHRQIAKMIKPGITTLEIDQFVERFLCRARGNAQNRKGIMAFLLLPVRR